MDSSHGNVCVGSVAGHISHGDVPLGLSYSSMTFWGRLSFAKLRLASAGGLRLGDSCGNGLTHTDGIPRPAPLTGLQNIV